MRLYGANKGITHISQIEYVMCVVYESFIYNRPIQTLATLYRRHETFVQRIVCVILQENLVVYLSLEQAVEVMNTLS